MNTECECICHGGAERCGCDCKTGLDAYVRDMQELSCYGDGRRRTKYRTIVIDPPWAYQDRWDHYLAYSKADGKTKNLDRRALQPLHYRRGAVANYCTLTLEELAALPVGEWADVDAHLYLWTTNSFMEEAHELVKAWGFKKKTILTWVKPRLGMGTYFRNNTEHVLFAVKGSLRTLRKDCRTAFEAPQGRHSEKPAAFYDMVETMSPGPRLDVFARAVRFGWDAYGNEVSGDGEIVHGPTWEPAVPAGPQPPPEARQPALLEEGRS